MDKWMDGSIDPMRDLSFSFWIIFFSQNDGISFFLSLSLVLIHLIYAKYKNKYSF